MFSSNCPPGLENLEITDKLFVDQQIEYLEVITGYETNNKYSIKNNLNQEIYFAVEDNDCCTMNCYGSSRPFDMKILDNSQNEVIHLYRELACSLCCCFPCCQEYMKVSSPPGSAIGTVEQEWSLCYPEFSIKNHLGDTILRIQGPFCTVECCGNIEFEVLNLRRQKVGKITKHWTNYVRESFTNADMFGITFPMDLDVRMKAVLLGACLLIDFAYYETTRSPPMQLHQAVR